MTVSLGKRLFDLPPNVSRRAALSLETAQPVPQTDDFLLFFGIHGGCFRGFAQCERKENEFQAAKDGVPQRECWTAPLE
jgi:hypothetical protein